MKQRLVFFIIIILISSFLFSQEITENPEVPLAPNAGRILNVQEVLRIQDQGDQFFFTQPINVQVADNSSLFISDVKGLLKFTSDGKFLTNLFKDGQGPGEIQGSFEIIIKNNDIFIYDNTALKIIKIDQNGSLINEYRLNERYNKFLGILNEEFIFAKLNLYQPGKSGKFSIPIHLFLVSQSGNSKLKSSDLSSEVFSKEGNLGVLSPFYYAFDQKNNTIFVCDTSEYLIQILELISGEIIKKFKRKYVRVKRKTGPMLPAASMKTSDNPYENDIKGLFGLNGNLLVRTSTKDESKGELFDLFNYKGQYLDSFYLNIGGILIGTYDNYLFAKEVNEEEEISIVKYRILE
ncbi:MAG: 6-bladed beta-propeller [Candidatus Aminicenantes bacterium]|nr:6-bladed beta-propeller [Candidatus Aminicenantes bacterium]